ncbi:chemotaxis protein [Campylobacter rectus]|uniref:chemotaxis protein n=1 Tax=Campylobacter rectus TaxID=203 RepID=UPI000F5F46D4|nr:chemotaxis protein [Campylobacter rectus]RRD55295.1 chemotaxis protein [Campylobacter rectus]
MVKEAGEPVRNFIELSKNDPKFKDYYCDFTDVGVQIFKIHEKLHADFAELKECEGIKALKEHKE